MGQPYPASARVADQFPTSQVVTDFTVHPKGLTTSRALPSSPSPLFYPARLSRPRPPAGRIDFARLADLAATFKPALIICGGSAYPREWEYKRFREIADANGACC